jgi:hypothetical protein
MNKTKKNILKNCNPKKNNLTYFCEVLPTGKCEYYHQCKRITKKKYDKLKKKIKIPKLYSWLF